jgi:hypothetical protein
MSPKVLRARTIGFEDMKGTDRLALANWTYLEIISAAPKSLHSTLPILLAAVAVILTRPAGLAPVAGLDGAEAGTTAVDATASFCTVAASSRYAIALALCSADGSRYGGPVDTQRAMAGVEAALVAVFDVVAVGAIEGTVLDVETRAATLNRQQPARISSYMVSTYMYLADASLS